ncbi:MAG: TolC family protein [Bacteroidales bacterium]
MKKLYYIILLLSVSFVGFGQSFDSFMQSIEQNNPRLITLQKWLEAEETKAKTGIYPDNPEVSYNYLWGNSDALGNQQELEITQTFKLPGYYTSKSAVQKLNFQQKQALAEKEKREILHTARTAWFNLVWLHKKEALLIIRKEDAEKLVAIMQEGFDGGEISKPAFDRARIYAMGVQTEWQKVQSEIEVQNLYLRQLNGDNSISSLVFEYPMDWVLPVLDSLLANLPENNPDLVMAQLGIQQSENEVKQQRMNSLPSFEAGYKLETILDHKLQGFHAGISIPLWKNTNSVKYAQLQTEWSKVNLTQQESEVKMLVSGLYYEIIALDKNYDQMRQIMDEETVSGSSLELLHSGQISFTEYLVDNELIWDTQSQFLVIENAYFTLLSKLKTFE